MCSDELTPPKHSAGDAGHAAIRAGLGAIPFFGGAAVEAFNAMIVPPIERRRGEWQVSVMEGLKELEQRYQTVVEDVVNDPLFVDTVLHASAAVIRTSHELKREALRNAVLNSALPQAPDETRRLLFIQLIDQFSPLHLRILTLMDDPDGWFTKHGLQKPRRDLDKLWDLIKLTFTDLESQEVLCERVCKDLNEKGLLIANSLRKRINRFPHFPDRTREQQQGYNFADELPSDSSSSYSGSPTAFRHWTTGLGREFLGFIASPIEAARPAA